MVTTGARGTLGVIAGIAIGCSVTYLARGLLHPAVTDGIKATPMVAKPADCAPKSELSEASAGLARNAVPTTNDTRAIAAARETDLVRAMARGLSRPEPAVQTIHQSPDRSH
jgi:hypothetical protein